MWDRLRADFNHCFSVAGAGQPLTLIQKLRVVADSPTLQAVAVYRFGAFVRRRRLFPPLRWLLAGAHYVLEKLSLLMWGIRIDADAVIGPGLYLGHTGGTLIGPVKMGEFCNVAHNVTIGMRADGRVSGVPTIGNRVWIGTGAVVFGRIVIGDGVTIGPLTVVGRNVPPGCLVAGNPMRVLRRDYDNTIQVFGHTQPLP